MAALKKSRKMKRRKTERKTEMIFEKIDHRLLFFHGNCQNRTYLPTLPAANTSIRQYLRNIICRRHRLHRTDQYMNVEEDFVKDLFFAAETRLGRVFVQEPVLMNDKTNHILRLQCLAAASAAVTDKRRMFSYILSNLRAM